jgi:hypothetical protein
MPRFLFRLALKCLLVFFVLAGAAKMIGSFNDHPAAALIKQFECSPQPCWHDIHVGVTSIQEALRLIEQRSNP